MIYLLIILIIIVCVLLIIAVLIQNPKSGGLGAGFGSMGNQVMGARRANDFIEKTTWSLVAALLVLSLFSGVTIKKGATAGTIQDTEVENKFKENSTPLPAGPAPGQQRPGAPGQGPQQGPPQGQPRPGGQPQQGQPQPQGQQRPAGQPQQPAAQPQTQQPAAQPQTK